MARRGLGTALLAHLVLAVVTLVIVAPVLYAFQVSTLDFQEVFVFPPRLTPGHSFGKNLGDAWEKVHLRRLLLNSAVIAVAVALGKICLSVLAAFAFTYFRPFPGRAAVFVLVMITHMLPLPVRIVPTFQLMHDFGWVNSYQALTVPFFASATGTLLFRQFFLTIPPSLSEAARIDGAGPLRFLLRVLLPISHLQRLHANLKAVLLRTHARTRPACSPVERADALRPVGQVPDGLVLHRRRASTLVG